MKHDPMNRRAVPDDASISIWAAGDGWKIRRLDWLQPAGAPVRGSLLFANGRGDFIEKYLEPMAHWHGEGWNVASFDWRSQGHSRGDIRNGHLGSFDRLVEDGAGLLGAWMAETPGPHVAIGHSMGGHLLLRILAELSPPLDAAALVAPMIGINSAPLPSLVAQMIAQSFCALGWGQMPVWRGGAARAGDWRRAILTSCPERSADENWWYERQPGYLLGSPTWAWLSAAYHSIATLTPERLERIRAPILILGTDRDRLVSPGAIRRAAGLLPRAELHMYPAAGHELLREADPVRLDALRRIDEFLARHADA
jgi:lysophospholipase